MHIQPKPPQAVTPLVVWERERGGQRDNDGFVLSAHPGKSQGRPRTTSSSQLISQNGLPVRVSQQRPRSPGTPRLTEAPDGSSSPDNGNEFRGGFPVAIESLGARHTKIRAGRPQTNGHVERLHRTILEECWRPAFARFLYLRYRGLQRELDAYLNLYNHHRAHTGRITAGRCPAELVYGARKMEPR